MTADIDLDAIASAVERQGLILRGGFNLPGNAETSPALSGYGVKAVLLVGNAGSNYWPHFCQWRRLLDAQLADPLDTWCRHVIGDVAERFKARAVSPSDRPFLPFQQWAMRAEGLRASPLGILMHPEYGLWHAYRGALLFDAELSIHDPDRVSHLCDACIGKPCMNACPVSAHSGAGFDNEACLGHVKTLRGRTCRDRGCLDRNACPEAAAYRYSVEAQRFHMASHIRPTPPLV